MCLVEGNIDDMTSFIKLKSEFCIWVFNPQKRGLRKLWSFSLSPIKPSLSNHSWDHEHVSAFTVQTRIDTRWVDLHSLLVHWFLLHIPEWCISSPLDHIGVWGSLWIFGVGEWRRGCTWLFDYFYTIQKISHSPRFSYLFLFQINTHVILILDCSKQKIFYFYFSLIH